MSKSSKHSTPKSQYRYMDPVSDSDTLSDESGQRKSKDGWFRKGTSRNIESKDRASFKRLHLSSESLMNRKIVQSDQQQSQSFADKCSQMSKQHSREASRDKRSGQKEENENAGKAIKNAIETELWHQPQSEVGPNERNFRHFAIE